MEFTPQELISALKLRNARLVGENLMVSCPFAKENHLGGVDSRRSFGIHIVTGAFNCLTCGMRGKTIRTLAFALNVLLPDTVMMKSLRIESDLAGLNKNKGVAQKVLYDITINDKFSLEHERAYSLLKYRGISKAAIIRFKVGFNVDTGAITFPSINAKNEFTGWVERNEGWANRYAFRPDRVKRNFMLFGLDRKIEVGYLTEGPVDALKLITWHIEGIATLGSKIFPEQAKLILDNCKSLVLVPDRDSSGEKWRKEARRLFRGKICLFEILVDNKYGDAGHPELIFKKFNSYPKIFIG